MPDDLLPRALCHGYEGREPRWLIANHDDTRRPHALVAVIEAVDCVAQGELLDARTMLLCLYGGWERM